MHSHFADGFGRDMQQPLLQRIQDMQQVLGLGVSICNNRIYVLGSISPVWWAHGLSTYKRFLEYKKMNGRVQIYKSWDSSIDCERQAQVKLARTGLILLSNFGSRHGQDLNDRERHINHMCIAQPSSDGNIRRGRNVPATSFRLNISF
jgi:hypothetical protein